MLQHKFRALCKKERWFQSGECVVVAVSGGVDSVVLLHLLKELRNPTHPLLVVHVDHQLRQESYRDARFVQELCEEWEIPCIVKTVTVREEGEKGSLQERARIARYKAFSEVMQREHSGILLTAHHADDQLETMVMRLARGTSLQGLSGIPRSRSFENGTVHRPLLSFTKEELREYAVVNNLRYREDPSNQKKTYTRNRIRHDVIPNLKEEAPQVARHASSLASRLQEDEELLQQLTKSFVERMTIQTTAVSWSISLQSFLEGALPLQRRAIHLILNCLSVEKSVTLTAQHIEDILHIANEPHPSLRVQLPAGIHVRRVYEELLFSTVPSSNVIPKGVQLFQGSSSAEWGKYSFTLEELGNPFCEWDTETYLVPDNAMFPLTIRVPQQGDRIQLLKGTKKLNRLFIDAKIPREKRRTWPVVVDAKGTILWVVGLRQSPSEKSRSEWVMRYIQK